VISVLRYLEQLFIKIEIEMKKIICVFLLLFVFGCTGSVPDGFPNVVPLTVWVTDGDKVLEDVFVVLETDPPIDGVSITARTDATGKATLRTAIGNYSKVGVPTGKVVMTLFKEPVVKDWKTAEEQSKMTMEELAAYSEEKTARSAKLPLIIPKIFNDVKTSPLSKEIVPAQSNEWKINIAEFRK
jgi:hypothetical protein